MRFAVSWLTHRCRMQHWRDGDRSYSGRSSALQEKRLADRYPGLRLVETPCIKAH
ncbi:MAG: hypothetical protein KME27_03495 [Lyngbya sp. HA4199-MV5]|nr:hypothetical protein [Lyngbya sp. HA4199-MV5]